MTGPLPDHALLVRYLLGELPEEARLKIEQDCLANDDLFEQLEAIEAELTDDYVRGALRGRQRHEFEQRLLKTAQIDLSKLLIAQSTSPSATPLPFTSFPAILWGSQSWLLPPFRRLFVSFATLSLAAFLCWFSLTHLLPKPTPQPPLIAQRTQPPVAEAPIAPPAARKSVVKRPTPPRPSTPFQPTDFTRASAPRQLPGHLEGTIVDPSGAAVPNAQVSLTNPTTGAVARSQTDSTGKYAIQLPAGDYSLSASASGFQPSNLQARIIPDQTVTQNLALSVSASTTTVEVTSAPATVDTTSAQLSTTFAGNALNKLPTLQTRSLKVASPQPAITPPNNSTNIFVNTSIVVFTPSTATVTLASPNGPVAGIVAVSTDHRYLTFTPSPGLSANTRYNVSLNGAVRTSFTTGASSENTAPTVQKISTMPHLVLQFSKPMDPSSFNAISATMRFSPDLRTVTFTSTQPITLTTAVKDIYGNSLPNQISF